MQRESYAGLGDKFRCAGVKEWFSGNTYNARENFAEAVGWYEQALLLYRQRGNSGKCVDVLSNIAYCQIKQGFVDQALASSKEASRFSAFSGDTELSKLTLERLALVATYAGHDQEAFLLWSRASNYSTSSEDDELNPVCFAIAGLLFVFLTNYTRKVFLSFLAFHWSARIHSVTNRFELLEQMDRLVTLELARGNIKVADRFSIYMLNIAHKLN